MLKSVIFCLLAVIVSAQTNTQKQHIKKIIEFSYIDGVYNQNESKIRKGFHKNFVMKSMTKDGLIKSTTLDKWVEGINKWKERIEKENSPKNKITFKIPLVDITSKVAVAKVLVFKNNRQAYTDYFSLYHFPNGWKIVSKAFTSH